MRISFDDLVLAPEEKWPFRRHRNYISLKSSVGDLDIPDDTRILKASSKDLHRIYTIRSENWLIEGIDEFLASLADENQKGEIFSVGFKLPARLILVVLDENNRYIAHIIKHG